MIDFTRFLVRYWLILMLMWPLLGIAQDRAAAESEPPAAEESMRTTFDPALIGLEGLAARLTNEEAFTQALAQVAARQTTLTAAADEPENDERLAHLEQLRMTLQRAADLSVRQNTLEQALAAHNEQQVAFARDGFNLEPPYPISLLDRLRAEQRQIKHSQDIAERLRDQARRQVERTTAALEQAHRARREARTRFEQTQALADERALEIARIGELIALHQADAALIQQEIARQEAELANARLELLQTQIARASADLDFSREMLEQRLAEISQREEAVQERIQQLNRRAERAEAALFEARRRVEDNNAGGAAALVQQERVLAREDEVTAARRGAEYLRHVINFSQPARHLIEWRYALIHGEQQTNWSRWLRELTELRQRLEDDQTFTQAELDILRSRELTLRQRLETADIEPALRPLIDERLAALRSQQELANELRLFQDQLANTMHALDAKLAAGVGDRTLGQRLASARVRIVRWWQTELFVINDHGFFLGDIALALGVFLLVLVVVSLLRRLLKRRVLPHLVGSADEGRDYKTARVMVSALIRHTSQFFVIVVAFYVAMSVSGLGDERLRHSLWTLLILAFYFQLGLWANAAVVDFFKRKRSRKERDDPSAVSGYGLLLFFLRVGIWLVLAISVLAHFRYPIAGLVGALGVSGLAVAFAVNNILSDIFSSMAIVLDKPFRVGDFVIAGETLGVVEHIGVKTTRIRSLSGEQVVLSNTNLLNSCIRNYKHMKERRVVFKFGVIYQTPPEKLERIPPILRGIIEQQSLARFDRAHFVEYGDFSLIIEVVYYVLSPDYTIYMDIQQAINLAMYRQFKAEGIEFAYPTQELIVRQSSPATTMLG